jgi:16S rRNA (cytidine1402-2'-O)-methyltransferase
MAVLYLFPSTLGDVNPGMVLPADNIRLISNIKHFVVEDARTARRFLKKCNHEIIIDDLQFFLLNEHTSQNEVYAMLKPLREGHDMGLLSDAGCPAVADPGADLVAIAQSEGIRVIPLVGPSSILLALMASGFNGQSFAFQGYLPVKPDEKIKAIKNMENRILSINQTQIFIETPYRNQKTVAEIIGACRPDLKLCIAADITLPSEFIKTQTLSQWKKEIPDLHKRPAIFLLYK